MMNSLSSPPLELCCIGELALRTLSNEMEGSVLASVTNATYLRSSQGELCWLIPKDGPMHQRGMAVTTSLPRWVVGSTYKVTERILATSSGELLIIQHPSTWMSPTISSMDIVPLAGLAKSILTLVDEILARNTPSGFGGLIMPILQGITPQNKNLEGCFNNSMIEKAWLAIHEMIQASLTKDTRRGIEFAKSLVGFGEGLTPSGDDFLGGYFFASQLLDKHYKNSLSLPFCTYLDFILQSKLLTNQISFAILKDHVKGHSVEPLHLLSSGLLMGKSVDRLIPHAEKLISLGHSTGWDLLSGFLVGMSVIFQPSR